MRTYQQPDYLHCPAGVPVRMASATAGCGAAMLHQGRARVVQLAAAFGAVGFGFIARKPEPNTNGAAVGNRLSAIGSAAHDLWPMPWGVRAGGILN
jgi:hypothetical protein